MRIGLRKTPPIAKSIEPFLIGNVIFVSKIYQIKFGKGMAIDFFES